MQQGRSAKLGLGEKLGYAVGDAGFNFYWIIIGSYLSYFYTDIFGITPAAAGTMFLVTKIADACTDPAMGAIADRTRSRWGQFRPYLLFGALPMAGAAILTMSTPDLGEGGKLAWAYATYFVMMVCYTVLSTPYSSLAGVITADGRERNSIFGLRFFFAYATGIFVGACTPGLAEYFAEGASEARGWQMTMALYSAIASVCFITVFFSTRERVQPTATETSTPARDIRDLLSNGPWLILFALALIIMMTIVFRGSSATYYFKYYVERPDLMGAYIGVQMAAYAVGCLLSPWLTRLMDKAKLLMLLMAIVGCLSVVFALIPRPESTGVVTIPAEQPVALEAEQLLGEQGTSLGNAEFHWFEHRSGVLWFQEERQLVQEGGSALQLAPGNLGRVISVQVVDGAGNVLADSADWPREIVLMFLLNILISLALGPKSPITWSMYADAADYNEWKTGRRATAMTFSAATFSQKLGGALASAVILWAMALSGYQANTMQAGASLNSIVWMQTLVPALFAFIAVFVLRGYRLDRDRLTTIQRELEARDESGFAT